MRRTTLKDVAKKLAIQISEDECSSAEVKELIIEPKKIIALLRCDNTFHENTLKSIERRLSQYFGVPTIIQRIDQNGHGLESFIKEEWDELVEKICDEIPPVRSMLSKNSFDIKNGTLTLYVKSEFARDYLIKKGLIDVVKGKLKDILYIDKAVKIEVNPSDDSLSPVASSSKQIVSRPLFTTHVTQSNPDNTMNTEAIPIDDVRKEMETVIIRGEIFYIEATSSTKKHKIIYVTDKTNSIKIRINENKIQTYSHIPLVKGKFIEVQGKVIRDSYHGDLFLEPLDIKEIPCIWRSDTASEKRVELHLHTKMSALDAVIDIDTLVRRLKEWGHKAVAVTDHGIVQSFPEFYRRCKENGIKPILGMEGYLIKGSDDIFIDWQMGDIDFKKTRYVVFDLETTSLNPKTGEIISIGAVKIEDGEIKSDFQRMIKIKGNLDAKTTKLTGITESMLKNGVPIKEALTDFLNFAGNDILVGHNVKFDYRFLSHSVKSNLGIKLKRPQIDTLGISRFLLKLKSNTLDSVAKRLGFGDFKHHRALEDAKMTAKIFLKFLSMLKEQHKVHKLSEFNDLMETSTPGSSKRYHATILVKNKKGLNNLYRLVSEAHTKYFYFKPRIPKKRLEKYRDGLFIGTACISGELTQAYLDGASDDELEKIASWYDYLEIQPTSNSEIWAEEHDISVTELEEMNRKIVELGDRLNKRVVMTSDAHFIDYEDASVRRLLQMGQRYKNWDKQPKTYLRTTNEMMEEAKRYLTPEQAYKVVIKNTNAIADEIEEVKITFDELHPPHIDGAEEEIKRICDRRLKELYGDSLPDLIQNRVNKELSAIIGNGYAVLYLIAQRLVAKSNRDGYIVGSRGSVGSSFVAFLLGITEVNPLPPHYRCPSCKRVEFVEDVDSGFDLPDKNCPSCGINMLKDGQNIPFEVFMGFKGDKIPDIDLNFAGEYQQRAHDYTVKLFGKEHVFRAGTISTIGEKTAFGYVKNFAEKTGRELNSAEMQRLILALTGVKRTTGQHPGGLMIIPQDMEVYDFTPIQFPANELNTHIKTTHFDYHFIHDALVKLDLLGHDNPTIIKMLKELTGVDPLKVPMSDHATMGLFSSTRSLKLKNRTNYFSVGTIGIPEFGTHFVRQMLKETKPKSFADLVRISGLSHGTDVWLNNAQRLISNGITDLSHVISVRDDVMNYLISKGMEPALAFKIMERVRKGKGLSEEEERKMGKLGIPSWYIDSCKKIKYMFPKAHAVAYVTMAFRIAYFKCHYPLAFYAVYFSTQGGLHAEWVKDGILGITKRLKELSARGNSLNAKERGESTSLEVAYEMILRGFEFKPLDLEKSDSTRFLIDGNGLRLPFSTLAGLGDKVANSIIETRKEMPFTSIEDLQKRTLLNKTHIEMMKRHGILNNIPEREQTSLFG